MTPLRSRQFKVAVVFLKWKFKSYILIVFAKEQVSLWLVSVKGDGSLKITKSMDPLRSILSMLLLAPIMVRAQCLGNSTHHPNITVSVSKTTIQTTYYRSTGISKTAQRTEGRLFSRKMVPGKTYNFKLDYPDGNEREFTMSRKGNQVDSNYYFYQIINGQRKGIVRKKLTLPYKASQYTFAYYEKLQADSKTVKRQKLALTLKFKCPSLSSRTITPQVETISLGVCIALIIGFQKHY